MYPRLRSNRSRQKRLAVAQRRAQIEDQKKKRCKERKRQASSRGSFGATQAEILDICTSMNPTVGASKRRYGTPRLYFSLSRVRRLRHVNESGNEISDSYLIVVVFSLGTVVAGFKELQSTQLVASCTISLHDCVSLLMTLDIHDIIYTPKQTGRDINKSRHVLESRGSET